MAYAAGVDVGSTQTKAVIVDEDRNIVGRSLLDTGANVVKAAESAYASALGAGDIEEREVEFIVGTGYGRYRVTFGNTQVTEISLPRQGAVHLFPNTRTVLDMGAGHEGDQRHRRRRDQRLLHERQVRRRYRTFPRSGGSRARPGVERPRADLAQVGAADQDQHHLHGLCRIRGAGMDRQGQEDRGHPVGVHMSIASRSVALMRRVGITDEVTFTGGVSLNVGMVKALGERLEKRSTSARTATTWGRWGRPCSPTITWWRAALLPGTEQG